jgi:histidinol-phosphate aminotransferase
VKEFENVILLRTCSKAFSAAGMRLGYLLAPPGLAADLRKLVPPFHLNLFAAVFGLTVWRQKEVFLERVRAILGERDRLMAALGKIRGLRVVPTHANFFLIRVENARALYDGLKDRSILVRAPSGGPALEDCLRINTGTPEENERLIEAIRSILTGAG